MVISAMNCPTVASEGTVSQRHKRRLIFHSVIILHDAFFPPRIFAVSTPVARNLAGTRLAQSAASLKCRTRWPYDSGDLLAAD